MASILITGFGPFPGMARNPSAWLARKVAEDVRLAWSGIEASAVVLTTSYAALSDEFPAALAREEPDCLLMLGVAARRKRICIETRAINRTSAYPDATGRISRTFAWIAGETPSRRPAISLQPLLRALSAHGVRPTLSRNAGRYLCNAAYYDAIGLMGDRPVVFLHVPMPKVLGRQGRAQDQRPDIKQMQAGLVSVAVVLAILSRRQERTAWTKFSNHDAVPVA